jgi:hypothetical protein
MLTSEVSIAAPWLAGGEKSSASSGAREKNVIVAPQKLASIIAVKK